MGGLLGQVRLRVSAVRRRDRRDVQRRHAIDHAGQRLQHTLHQSRWRGGVLYGQGVPGASREEDEADELLLQVHERALDEDRRLRRGEAERRSLSNTLHASVVQNAVGRGDATYEWHGASE